MINQQGYIFYELAPDPRINAYFEEIFSSGKELSHFLHRNIQVDEGKVFSILPSTFDKKEIYDFQKGGKIKNADTKKNYEMLLLIRGTLTEFTAERVPNTDLLLAKLIYKFLAENKGICLLEDATSVSSDRCMYNLINEKQYSITTLGESVYFWFSSNEQNDLQTIQRVIEICKSLWHFVCVFAKVDLEKIEQKINVTTLTEIARNTDGIAIEAYDGESYLLWSNRATFIKLLMPQLSDFEE